MKVGILQGSHPERVHIAGDDCPACGAKSGNKWQGPTKTDAFWRWWPGTLREVDCKRCLVMHRRDLNNELHLVEQRLAGEGGIQRTIFEKRKRKK